jgi:ribosomal protein S18 acetylase RimI-like enzyme
VENVIIRKIKPADTDAILRIYKYITKRSDIVDFKQIMDEQVLGEGNACFVAEHEGRVVGYIVSYVLTGSFGIQQSAWIPMFGVDPDYMGHGIGHQLAEAVFKFYKSQKIENIYTSVRWYDTDVLSFLRTLGFDRSEFIALKKRLD